MPKKDINEAVLGMLSNAGTATLPPPREELPAPAATPATVEADVPAPTVNADVPAPTVSAVERAPAAAPDEPPQVAAAPRTMRLRPTAAHELREAWLEAKRDDVLLTAQDFASDLVEEMLRARRRRSSRVAS